MCLKVKLVSCELGSGAADLGVAACSGGKAKPCCAMGINVLTPEEQRPGTGSFPFHSHAMPRGGRGSLSPVTWFQNLSQAFLGSVAKAARLCSPPPPFLPPLTEIHFPACSLPSAGTSLDKSFLND